MRAKDIAALSAILELLPKFREDVEKVKDANGVEVGAGISQVGIILPGEEDEEGVQTYASATLSWDEEREEWTLST